MSDPEKCRICGCHLEHDQRGYCDDCAYSVLTETHDMGVAW